MSNERSLPLEIFPPFTSDVPTVIKESDTAMETYKDHLLSLRWDELHNQSAKMAGVADKILRDIQSRCDLESLWSGSLSERDGDIRNLFAALAGDNSPNATQGIANLLAELTQQLNGDSVAGQAALDELLDGSSSALNSSKTQKTMISITRACLT